MKHLSESLLCLLRQRHVLSCSLDELMASFVKPALHQQIAPPISRTSFGFPVSERQSPAAKMRAIMLLLEFVKPSRKGICKLEGDIF